jgi:hypothetical protein
MGFYWKDGKDQLLARSGDLPPSSTPEAERSTSGNPWTTFTMALREPAPIEAPLDFARFLVTSITFMRTIKRIDMIVDDTKVLEVRKDIKGQSGVSRAGLNTTSSVGMMKVVGVDATSMVITARVMKWLSGELECKYSKLTFSDWYCPACDPAGAKVPQADRTVRIVLWPKRHAFPSTSANAVPDAADEPHRGRRACA